MVKLIIDERPSRQSYIIFFFQSAPFFLLTNHSHQSELCHITSQMCLILFSFASHRNKLKFVLDREFI